MFVLRAVRGLSRGLREWEWEWVVAGGGLAWPLSALSAPPAPPALPALLVVVLLGQAAVRADLALIVR
ncbi:hypothetical protein ACIGXI_36505 [Kitasatospora aureofaciens]|uniref:hypothetical protein n=1 Tax=Kitasatospora aureofaciens TaxID=1894 RepID=UPI0037CA36B2